MAKDMSIVAEGKHTSGYYNPNRWPIQLVVSRLNVTLHLPPNAFILDKEGRKINDPLFDLYVKSGQLARELSDNVVPHIYVPAPVNAPHLSSPDGQSVHTVTEFTTDKRGVRQPVMPKSQVMEQQAINKPSYTGMSMDEARRQGLIKKVREVPEDYGVTDTNSALPPRTPPPMRIAVDTDQNAKPAAIPERLQNALPKEDRSERKQLQEALQAGAAVTEMLDTETGFLNVATQHNPNSIGIRVGVPTVQTAPVTPAPNISEEAEEEEVPAPEQAVKPKVQMKGRFVCMECGETFKFRPELQSHARKTHPDKSTAVMASYPASI